ncbi:TetR/AcrR family transcriptional regulator [Tessaracoccus sp. OS52]|uniref:TetR/AcrR family transcriptional regulator n=1 Tax=Tessaracoccus sp. OS52 TaxID=2886691 RepID=UPI001D1303AC|nr:TetR/AcrR family transcriptional regulator [Tessaracoccus sp. OS52]MCC2591862.1 TetR/AcrR family transcriptional regulator [Tessaracoccus sp. OS52]
MESEEILEPRERILHAAKEVFGAHGYQGGSLNEVAKRSGYTRAGLLHYFPSKEAILLALLDLRDERLHILDDQAAQDGGILHLLDLLPDIVTEILKDRLLVQLAHVLTAEASDPDHPARAWASRRHELVRRGAAEAVRSSIERGEVRADADPDAIAALLLGAAEGVEAQWLVNPDVDPRRCTEVMVEMIRAALVP